MRITTGSRRHGARAAARLLGVVALMTSSMVIATGTASAAGAMESDDLGGAALDEGGTIDIWYGDQQSFGQNGTQQDYINVLGTWEYTGPDVLYLSYTVNGVAPDDPNDAHLKVGPDTRRLLKDGDFNVDLAVDDPRLVVGENTIEISVTTGQPNVVVREQVEMIVDYAGDQGRSLPYHIDWSEVGGPSAINTVAHVVDGEWDITSDGLRTAEDATGYDRLVAIGDRSWDDYEVTVPITVHSIEPDPGHPSGTPMVGLLMRWHGHTDAPPEVAGMQPKSGWDPHGNIGGWRNGELLWNDPPSPEVLSDIAIGVEHIWKARVETDPGTGESTYSLKTWLAGTEEPPDWEVQAGGNLDTGSLVLLAHHMDVTFGNVSVVGVPSAPSGVSALAGNRQATVSWSPASDGGSPITEYAVTASPGGHQCLTTVELSCTVDGLTNGQSYTFTVSATNEIGTSPASAPSAAVTPATVPGAPTGVVASAGSGQGTVSWSAPASNGGSPITGYTVRSSPGGHQCSTSGSRSCTVTGLTNGTSYTFTVRATNAIGSGPWSAPSTAVTPTTPTPPPTTNPPPPPTTNPPPTTGAGVFTGIVPERLVDTRRGQGGGIQDHNGVIEIDVGADPVALNLTAVAPTGPGHFVVYPCADGNGSTSSLNWSTADLVVPNMVLATPDGNGRVCVESALPQGGQVHVVVDRTGTLYSAGGFAGQSPERLRDTRREHGKLAAGATMRVGGLEPNAGAILNLTVALPDGAGHLTAYPCAAGRPTASVSNYSIGQTKANTTAVKADANGEVCIFTHASTHLIVDLFGTIAGSDAHFITPKRLHDSRRDGGKQEIYTVTIPDARGRAAILNVTAALSTGLGHATVYPCNGPVPTASTVNFVAGQTVPNHVLIAPNGQGEVCIATVGNPHIIVDLAGYLGQGG